MIIISPLTDPFKVECWSSGSTAVGDEDCASISGYMYRGAWKPEH